MKRLFAAAAVFVLLASACSPQLNLNRVRGIRGPNAPVVTESAVKFTVSAPGATYVTVAGNFNGWNPRATEMTNDSGLWTVTVDMPARLKYYYKFVIDGFWVADPDNPDTVPDGFGGVNSVLDLRNP